MGLLTDFFVATLEEAARYDEILNREDLEEGEEGEEVEDAPALLRVEAPEGSASQNPAPATSLRSPRANPIGERFGVSTRYLRPIVTTQQIAIIEFQTRENSPRQCVDDQRAP